MKKRKLWLFGTTLLLAVGLTCAFAACGDGDDNGGNNGGDTTYTVTYVANNGSDATHAGGTYKAGATVTVAAGDTFSYDYHTFDKWSDGVKSYTAGSTFSMPKNDVTLTAQWTLTPAPEGYKTIVYGHASSAPADVTDIFPNLPYANPGDTVDIPEVTYAIPHYTFNGWNVYKLVGGDWEQDYDTFPSRIANGGSFTMPDYNIMLVTNFTKNDVTIKFDANGGSGTMADVTTGFSYGSNLSAFSSKITNKFTGPNGAEFLYWSVTPNGNNIFANDNAMALTEANGVTADDVLTLYAIWDSTSVKPDPVPDGTQNIADYVGKWETQEVSGNHTITVIAKTGAYGIVGYAVLDGKTFITIYDEDGTLVASNTDDEYVTNYAFAISGNTFTLKEIGENTYNFTKKTNVPDTAASTFLGKWKRSATQKVLIAADGVAYYSYQGIKTVEWLKVGEYLVFSYTASNGFDYYYILTKSGNELTGYFLAPDAPQAATTFTANGFYTLTVGGVVTEFVNEGNKPTAIADPTPEAGKKFDGWKLAGTGTAFDFDEVMTADASIEATFVKDDGPSTSNAVTYVGNWKGMTKVVIDTEAKTMVFTINNVETATYTYEIKGRDFVLRVAEIGEELYFYMNGDTLDIYDWPSDNSGAEHYATFTKA